MIDNLLGRIGLGQFNRANDTWDVDNNVNLAIVQSLLTPSNVFWVSPEYSDSVFAGRSLTDRRHFDTIQGAIDAWESAGYGDNNYGGILVLPGSYAERLTITKSVGLYALGGGGPESVGACRTVSLNGDGTAGPLITFDPADGEHHGLAIAGFQLRNLASAQGSEQTTAILYVVDQGAGNYGAYPSTVHLIDCSCRLSNGNNNGWTYGTTVRGNATLRVFGGRWLFPSDYDGYKYVRHAWHGNAPVAGANARIEFSGVHVTHPALYGTSVPSSVMFYSGDGCSGLVTRSNLSRGISSGLRLQSGSGLIATGLSDATELAAYGNLTGINTALF